MMQQVVAILLVTLSLSSCSNLTKNLVKSGEFSVHRGVYENKKWDENLLFVRKSWYHELTLHFDLMAAGITSENPFYHWFSETEKNALNACANVIVLLSYQFDADRISTTSLDNQLREQGLKLVSIPAFQNQMRNHPDFEHLSLSLYRVKALCAESKKMEVKILFPGHPEQKINF